MNGKAEFLEKLMGLVSLAKENGSQISIEEVKQYFSEEELTEEQIELVFDYLLAQKVVVRGYLKMESTDEEKKVVFTEEEKAYLKEYLEDLKAFREAAEGEKEALYAKVVQGDVNAKNRLVEFYLKEVVEIAKEMYQEEIFLGDMIQEGNVGLMLGIEMIENVEEAHNVIVAQIRQNIQMLTEEYAEAASRDKKMVEKVSFLDESIEKLTEELGRKVAIDELAVYMGLTEEEIADILRLTGEETEEEKV